MKFKSIFFEITNFCNQKCIHCYLDGGPHKPLYELNTKTCKQIILNFAKQDGKMIYFTGGEPFCRNDLFEIFDYVNEQQIYFNVATNGTLINEELIERYSNYKYQVGIDTSLLGSNALEHKIIANNNSFDLTIENLKLFKKYNINSLVQITNGRNSFSKINEIASLLAKHNCLMKFTPIVSTGIKGNSDKTKDIKFSPNECLEFIKLWKNLCNKYGDKILPHNLFTYDTLKEFIDSSKQCPIYSIDEHSLLIRPDGKKVFEYAHYEPTYHFGYAQEEIEISNNDTIQSYAKLLQKVDNKLLLTIEQEKVIDFSNERAILISQEYQNSYNSRG